MQQAWLVLAAMVANVLFVLVLQLRDGPLIDRCATVWLEEENI